MLDHVTYPPPHDPRISAIYALNEIDVKAPAELQLLDGSRQLRSSDSPARSCA